MNGTGMLRRNLTHRLFWIALNGLVWLGMAAVAYRLEGWHAAVPWVMLFAFGAAVVLLRRPTESHP